MDNQKEQFFTMLKVAAIAFGALILFNVGCSAIRTVPSGSVGVVTRFGATTGQQLEPGLHFVTPFVTGIERMDVQTHAFKATASAASKDLQTVSTEITLNFRLDPKGAVRMYNEMRRDYEQRIINPSVQEAVKATTAHYNAEELVTRREEVRTAIEGVLRDRLARHSLLLDQVSVTNFAFSADFAAAIEDKQVATQKAQAAENRVREATANANAVIAKAKGDAEAIRIQAEAIRSQGGEAYVMLQAIEAWKSGGALVPSYLVMGSGHTPVPFLNIGGSK